MGKPKILAIDPGPARSAWVFFDGINILDKSIEDNEDVLQKLRRADFTGPLIIEMIASYGMPVGREVFETCVWIGRFAERHLGDSHFLYRTKIKMHLCQTARAKDSNIRQALLDRFGPGRKLAIGLKKTPGPLYGFKKDLWSALAVAVTWMDQHSEVQA